MNNAEIARRLANLTPAQIANIRKDLEAGNSAYAVAGYAKGDYFKAVNAVAELMVIEAKAPKEKFAAKLGYTDVHPYEVVRALGEKALEIRAMDSVLSANWKPEIIPGGFVGHCTNQNTQSWVCSSNPERPVVVIRQRSNGEWFDKYGNRYQLGDKPRRFHDYNF